MTLAPVSAGVTMVTLYGLFEGIRPISLPVGSTVASTLQVAGGATNQGRDTDNKDADSAQPLTKTAGILKADGSAHDLL